MIIIQHVGVVLKGMRICLSNDVKFATILNHNSILLIIISNLYHIT